MILHRLVAENFRAYLGRQEVEFASPGGRNVTVVRGLNGTGKSTLFQALKWCFGDSLPVEQRHLVCTAAVAQAAPGEIVETRVEVTYSHQDRRYRAIRSFRTRVGSPVPDGELSYAPEPTAQIQLYEISDVGEATPVAAQYDELQRAVPREALDYFFFDGEQIGRFADDSGGGSIRDAVRQVLRFAELENAIRHVDAARLEFSKKQRHEAGGDAATLIQQREDWMAEAERLRLVVADLDEKTAQARRVHDEFLTRLKELAVVRELTEERSRLKAQREELASQRDQAMADIAASLPGLSIVLADDALARAKGLVDSKRRRGEIPSRVKAQVLRDWLESGKCICGRPLAHGSAEHEAIRAELEHSLPSRLEEELTMLGGSIDASRREGERQLASGRRSLARLNQARELSMAVTDRLAEIDRELGDQPGEDVAAIAARVRQQERDIEDWTTRRAEANSLALRAHSEIDRLRTEVARAEVHNREAVRLGRRHDLAARTVDALRDLKATFESDIRCEVEAKASQLFSELIWKSGHFEAVTLSPDFRLEAVDRWGEPAFSTGGTSMGESRVLSIAFIVAMQVVAKASLDTRSPTVIDSPFGNLSIEPARKICEKLPCLVDQVVLFLTDADWQSCGDALVERMGRFYDLQFSETESVARIVEARS